MKSFILFIASFCLGVSLQASEVVYPQLRTVIDKLFNTYDVPETTFESNLHFAKKPEGWFVQWTDQSKVPVAVISEELFWSARKSKFIALKTLKPGKTYIAEGKKKSTFYGNEYYYSRIPYFGYIGWDRDVIHDFGTSKITSDTLLEGLGRAYSNYAFGFSGRYYDYHLPVNGLDAKAQLDSFIYYQKLSIAIFDILRKKNTEYELIAGNPNTKYANEIMMFYDYLQLINMEHLVTPYFQEDLYDPLMVANAKEMLSQCDTNAILFTSGDNKTFPLEYLQFVKGYRTDVTVLNDGLMYRASILNQAALGRGKALPIKFTFAMDKYYARESNYFMNNNPEPDPMTYAAFLEKIKYEHAYSDGQSSGYGYYTFSPCTISFAAHFAIFSQYQNSDSDSIAFIYLKEHYLSRAVFAQLDIIISNLDERPIYFTGAYPDFVIGIENYLFSKGLVKQFIPQINPNGSSEFPFGGKGFNEPGYTNMMKFNFNFSSAIDKYSGDQFVTNLRLQYFQLAMNFISKQPEKAVRLLDHCDSLFPPDQWKYEPICAYAVDAYYKCSQKVKGDWIAFRLFDDFEKQLQDKKKSLTEVERTRMIQAANIIQQSATHFNRPNIVERSAKVLELLNVPQKGN